MIKRDAQFTGQGGVRLHWQTWQPEDAVRAVLLVSHGYGEHASRYAHLVDSFVPLGYAVQALDHRGHGRSEGPRGHVGRFREFVSDFHAFRVRVEEEFRDKPLVLVGHSMGGLIALHYVLEHGAGLAALVLSSPALGLVDPPSRFLRWVARVLSVVAPRTSFQGNVKPELLSHDPSVGRAYSSDPLVHGRATARFFTEFQDAIRSAHERASEVTLPVLVLQAGEDRLVVPAAAGEVARRLGSEDKELRVYPGFFHELFNEVRKEEVFADMERWLRARIGG
ncbi:MAG: lysophospholipase [Candidatus Binatia bacterium]